MVRPKSTGQKRGGDGAAGSSRSESLILPSTSYDVANDKILEMYQLPIYTKENHSTTLKMARPKSTDQKRGGDGAAGSSTSESLSLPSTSHAMPNDVTDSVHILDLPTELIEKILCYSSYEQISKYRRVCTRFNEIGSSLLNSAFQRLQNNMLQRFHKIKSQMPRRESARRTHPLARECDIVETVHMRLTLLQMTFGKYIEKKFCCFWPGEILDEVHRIFHYIKTTPNLARAYKVTDELFDLTTMAMEYFKEYIEPHLPEITYFATDFLDYTTFSATGVKSCAWKSTSSADGATGSSSPGPIAEERPELPTASGMLKKKLKQLRQGMKKNNSQLTVLKRKVSSSSNKIADQQKQLMDYSARFEDYDKKFEENSRKFSSVLQELNKCKTELQYWRSKSPANNLPCCSCCATFGTNDNVKPMGDACVESGEGDDAHICLPVLASLSDDNSVTGGFIPIPTREGGASSIDDTSSCSRDELSLNRTVKETRSPRLCAATSAKINSEIQEKSQLNLRSKRKASRAEEDLKESIVKRSKKNTKSQ